MEGGERQVGREIRIKSCRESPAGLGIEARGRGGGGGWAAHRGAGVKLLLLMAAIQTGKETARNMERKDNRRPVSDTGD